MTDKPPSELVRRCGLLLVLTVSVSVRAQTPAGPTSEDIAFDAVRAATNAASSIAAAEEFFARFPQSNKRVLVARLVVNQLKTIRNPEIGIVLIDRARAIFTEPDELNFLQPVAVEIYANGNRIDEAFAAGASQLSRRPYEFSLLSKLTHLGAREAHKKNLVHLDASLEYGARAIELLEHEKRGTEQTDTEWLEAKAQLPSLYQDIGVIKLAQGKTDEAKVYVLKATQLDARNPNSFGLLARILDDDYTKLRLAYDSTADAGAKADLKVKLDALLDELIETYARAAALATGRREYIVLLQQLIPDLTRHYKARHNDIGGLQQLIEKYR